MTQPYISDSLRDQIKACKGTLSLSLAAKKFGVSRRTVGRIYHEGELAPSKDELVESLRLEVAELKQLVQTLVSAQSMSSQRLRRAPNPAFDGKSFRSLAQDYSSPYRDNPGMELATVHSVQVPIPFGWRDIATDSWFKSQNPASPGCQKYPYPQSRDPKAGKGVDLVDEPIFQDPPIGTHCGCEDCLSWRLRLAYEDAMTRSYQHAVAEAAAWRRR